MHTALNMVMEGQYMRWSAWMRWRTAEKRTQKTASPPHPKKNPSSPKKPPAPTNSLVQCDHRPSCIPKCTCGTSRHKNKKSWSMLFLQRLDSTPSLHTRATMHLPFDTQYSALSTRRYVAGCHHPIWQYFWPKWIWGDLPCLVQMRVLMLVNLQTALHFHQYVDGIGSITTALL